jgi:hypothetical protein
VVGFLRRGRHVFVEMLIQLDLVDRIGDSLAGQPICGLALPHEQNSDTHRFH